MAERCNRRYAVTVNSCTQALILAQMAITAQEQQIIIPNISFAATLNSVLMANNQPVFCDVDYHGILDLDRISVDMDENKINVMMYVNLFGNIIDYDKLQVICKFFNQDEIMVIEDAAQSFGGYYRGMPSGSLGDISVISFDPTKNLPNYGSGGMILTDDWHIYNHVVNYKNNGKYDDHNMMGTNSQMSEADCAQMVVKLKYFDAWQARRRDIAEYYIDRLANHVRVTEVDDHVVHAWQKFPIWIEEPANNTISGKRNTLITKLANSGVECKVHYAQALDELPLAPPPHTSAYNFMGSRKHCNSELSLPIYPEMTDLEVEFVAQCLLDHIN